MATDPTRSITRRRFASPFAMGAEDLLDRLAQLAPATETPYLTVTLDWSVEGTSPGRAEPEDVQRSQDRSGWEEGDRWRPSIEIYERQIDDLIEAHGPRGEIFDSLSADKERIAHYLQNDLDPAAHGVVIVANSAAGTFEAAGLSLPVETSVHTGPVPALYDLVRVIEDNPVYAVLLADQYEAMLSFITYGGVSRRTTLESSEYPVKQQQGGWSQRRFQARADERVEAFARDIAEETRAALDRLGVDSLIVAGSEVITSALDAEFHETVKNRIVSTIRMEMTASDDDLIKATFPVVEEAERQRETDAVQRLSDHVGSGDRGASGVSDTLRALQNGQANELVMLDTFEGTGWADYSMHVFGVGNHPTTHPVGGDVANIVDVDLKQELVRLALATDAEVEIVHSDVPVPEGDEVPDAGERRPMTPAANMLSELGDVGAILRYDLDETAPDQGV